MRRVLMVLALVGLLLLAGCVGAGSTEDGASANESDPHSATSIGSEDVNSFTRTVDGTTYVCFTHYNDWDGQVAMDCEAVPQ